MSQPIDSAGKPAKVDRRRNPAYKGTYKELIKVCVARYGSMPGFQSNLCAFFRDNPKAAADFQHQLLPQLWDYAPLPSETAAQVLAHRLTSYSYSAAYKRKLAAEQVQQAGVSDTTPREEIIKNAVTAFREAMQHMQAKPTWSEYDHRAVRKLITNITALKQR